MTCIHAEMNGDPSQHCSCVPVLRAEIERLRGERDHFREAWAAAQVRLDCGVAREVAYLRACVPPTHPSHYGYEAWEERLRGEVERERAAVVAYLLAPGTSCDNAWLAETIERGEHRREEEP